MESPAPAPASGDYRGDAPDVPTAASPPASPPTSPASSPSAPAPSDASTPLIWADLAEDEDVAAGRPVVCRDRVPPPAPARSPTLLAPRGGGSAARARAQSRRGSSSARPSSGQGPALGTGRSHRRRRAAGWGVTGRADLGPARSSWRSSGVVAVAEVATPPPEIAADLFVPARHTPFRPFIATFGSSWLRFVSVHRAVRPCPPLRRPAPAPPAPAAVGETLAVCPSRACVVGRPSRAGPPPAAPAAGLVLGLGLPRPTEGAGPSQGLLTRPPPVHSIWPPQGFPVQPPRSPLPSVPPPPPRLAPAAPALPPSPDLGPAPSPEMTREWGTTPAGPSAGPGRPPCPVPLVTRGPSPGGGPAPRAGLQGLAPLSSPRSSAFPQP
nr:actin cytoskeleton-regulatory complex protein PAN1-like [Aegilops tauschii subsp. strangulata]